METEPDKHLDPALPEAVKARMSQLHSQELSCFFVCLFVLHKLVELRFLEFALRSPEYMEKDSEAMSRSLEEEPA